MTGQELARQYQRRAAAVPREFRKTMRGLGSSAVHFTKEKLTEEVYSVPEDIDPRTGQKKWKRTHRLLKGEKYEVRGDFEVAIVNTVPYARPRHDAGKPGHRKINPLRESHWRDELVKTFQPLLLDIAQATMRDVLEKP